MATLKNSRNIYFYDATTRILGANVYITTGLSTSFTLPANSSTCIPGSLELTAVSSMYTTPQYTWSRRFGGSGAWSTITGATSRIYNASGDSTFIEEARGFSVVQYKVDVVENSSIITNPSSYIVTIPIIRQGIDGIIVEMSNPSYIVPASSTGVVSTYANSGTSIKVREGNTHLTYRSNLGTYRSSFTLGTPVLSVADSLTIGTISGDGTTSAILGNHSFMTEPVVVVTIPITIIRYDGTELVQTIRQTLAKALAGSIGVRGSRSIYTTHPSYNSYTDFSSIATLLIAAEVAGSNPTTPITGDTVTFSNGTSFVYTVTYNANTSSWAFPGTVIDGNLLVTGSVTTSKLSAGSIDVSRYIQSSNYNPGVAGWIIHGDGTLEANSGTFRGNVEASTFSTPDNRFTVNSDGSVIADMVDIRRRIVIATGSLDPTNVITGYSISSGGDKGSSTTVTYYQVGSVFTGTVIHQIAPDVNTSLVNTDIYDLYTQSSTSNQPYYVAANFNGTTLREWSGSAGSTFDLTIDGSVTSIRTYSNSGSYVSNGRLAIVFTYAIRLESGSFNSFRLPTATWTLYKI